jgi:hypothetical protein
MRRNLPLMGTKFAGAEAVKGFRGSPLPSESMTVASAINSSDAVTSNSHVSQHRSCHRSTLAACFLFILCRLCLNCRRVLVGEFPVNRGHFFCALLLIGIRQPLVKIGSTGL